MKGSFNPDLAKQGGGGLEKGKVRVKAGKTQNIKTDFKANQLYLVLDVEMLDENWNTVREAEPVGRSTGIMVFFDSLVKHGFPKAILDLGWAPSFVGMEFEFATYTSKECNEKFGTRLSTKPIERTDDKGNKESVNVTYKVATKWNNVNYLGNGNGVSSASSQIATGTATSAAASEPDEPKEATFSRLVKV